MTNRPPLPLPPFFFEKSNIEDDEDDVALAKLFMDYEERDTKLLYERLDWNKHVHLSIANNTFHRHYHMTIESFKKTCFHSTTISCGKCDKIIQQFQREFTNSYRTCRWCWPTVFGW